MKRSNKDRLFGDKVYLCRVEFVYLTEAWNEIEAVDELLIFTKTTNEKTAYYKATQKLSELLLGDKR